MYSHALILQTEAHYGMTCKLITESQATKLVTNQSYNWVLTNEVWIGEILDTNPGEYATFIMIVTVDQRNGVFGFDTGQHERESQLITKILAD